MKKTYFVQLISITFLALLIGNFANAASFNDVTADHANSDAIEYVKTNGIVSGYPDGSFKPDSTINRAEFTKIIVGAKFDASTIDNCITENVQGSWTYVFFPDVPKDAWFAKYICVAKINNIVAGYPDGTFKPANDINFAEASKIIVNTFGYTVGTDSVWYKPFVEKLGEKMAIPVTIASFDKNITRGEMAEMVYRLKANITNKESLNYESIASMPTTSANSIFTSKDKKLSFSYRNDWICKEVKYGETVYCYSETMKAGEQDIGLDQPTVANPEIVIDIQNCDAKPTSEERKNYPSDGEGFGIVYPLTDSAAQSLLGGGFHVIENFNSCHVDVMFGNNIAYQGLYDFQFPPKPITNQTFTSKDNKLSFSYRNDWICKEAKYGEKIYCYSETMKAGEQDIGLDQPTVANPEIVIDIQNCDAKPTSDERKNYPSDGEGFDIVYPITNPAAQLLLGGGYHVIKDFNDCHVDVMFDNNIAYQGLYDFQFPPNQQNY